jgi:hypothetical protein
MSGGDRGELAAAIGRLERELEAAYAELEGATEARRPRIETHIENIRTTIAHYRREMSH